MQARQRTLLLAGWPGSKVKHKSYDFNGNQTLLSSCIDHHIHRTLQDDEHAGALLALFENVGVCLELFEFGGHDHIPTYIVR